MASTGLQHPQSSLSLRIPSPLPCRCARPNPGAPQPPPCPAPQPACPGPEHHTTNHRAAPGSSHLQPNSRATPTLNASVARKQISLLLIAESRRPAAGSGPVRARAQRHTSASWRAEWGRGGQRAGGRARARRKGGLARAGAGVCAQVAACVFVIQRGCLTAGLGVWCVRAVRAYVLLRSACRQAIWAVLCLQGRWPPKC